MEMADFNATSSERPCNGLVSECRRRDWTNFSTKWTATTTALLLLTSGGETKHGGCPILTCLAADKHCRDFLLFIPAAAPNLQEVFSYFSSTVRVNPEGDVQISDDLIDGLGITQRFLNLFFGSIIRIAKPQQRSHIYYKSEAVLADEFAQEEATKLPYLSPRVTVEVPPVEEPHTVWDTWDEWKEWLISYVHFSGYFVAGGVSGIVSRTATAPLDRLKVYLIAKTEVSDVLGEAKSGKPLTAVKRAWTPLVSAMKELWAVGGMRSLFAGEY